MAAFLRKAMESASKSSEEEEKKKKVEEARRLKDEEEARRLKAEEEARRLKAEEEARRLKAEEEARRLKAEEEERLKKQEQEQLSAQIQELKEEAKRLALVKENEKLELEKITKMKEELAQLELAKLKESMQRQNSSAQESKSPWLQPVVTSSGKDFKCENPDDVEIKGAQLLSHKLGISDHSLDGLYYGSFTQKVSLKKKSCQAIIKESLPSRNRAISHEVDIYTYIQDLLSANTKVSSFIEMYGYSLTATPPFIVLEDFGEDLRHYLQPDIDHDTKRQVLKKCVEGIIIIYTYHSHSHNHNHNSVTCSSLSKAYAWRFKACKYSSSSSKRFTTTILHFTTVVLILYYKSR